MESNQQWKITKSKFVAVTNFPDSDDNDNIFFFKIKIYIQVNIRDWFNAI